MNEAACVAPALAGPVVRARPGDWRRPAGVRPGEWWRPSKERPPDRRPPRRWDRGSATVELAVALPSLVLLLGMAMTGVQAMWVQVQCVSAARDGALGAARGDGGEAAARRAAPDGASVSVTVSGEQARAAVSAPVRPLGGFLPTITVRASSVAAVEPGVP